MQSCDDDAKEPQKPSPGGAGGDDAPPQSMRVVPSRRDRGRLVLMILGLLFAWTYLYNLLLKDMGPVRSFFEVLNTISDDFVVGSLITLIVGVLILVAFTVTKLYTQVISNLHSFRILEEMAYEQLFKGRWRAFFRCLLNFEDQPKPATIYPRRASSMFVAFAAIYIMSWIYVVVFSEALFFVAWSAGVNLPITKENLLLLPTLALAIPFSARVMAYLRYRYTQDYADFMPGAVFVLLLVASLGTLFGSKDLKFFVMQVASDRDFYVPFLRNGTFLAFIPLFSEAVFWLVSVSMETEDAS